ncbi:NUDIX hydrolase [Dyadobacter fermentans]|uniref:NUDIX hydrolase n=1 Tax=Dyadobacter fermentans (strain ATCC 700827 / DSM 18053 / CIP 107007 / KCTC 52180 / NS114) TaxID=471854 RepID=C6W4F0_DYAFD|nr:NUDIX hydrolase [Dyadobacter fermentans]ACT94051.1 NUDIX hydrolase [Dyadobacter fermentans DSM 18053]
MISLRIDGALFNYRVAGVAVLNDKVLLHKTPSDNFWTLPGGRCELFEFSKDTLQREMQEETGLAAEAGEMLWVSENFFLYNGDKYHEIGFYFEMQIRDLPHQDDFLGAEGQDELLFHWHDVADLHSIRVYPEFLADALTQNPLEKGHFSAEFRDLDAG